MKRSLEEHKMFAFQYTALDKCLCYAVIHWPDHLLSSAKHIELLDIIENWDMSQWGRAIISSRIFSMEPLMRITEALSSSYDKNCSKEYSDALAQHASRSIDKVFTTFLDEHQDIAPTLIPMVTFSIPNGHPDYALRDITKSKKTILWLDTLMQLARFQSFQDFVASPIRSGRYFCGPESHSRAFIMLLNYIRSPVLYAFHSLEDDEAFDYAISTAAFHLKFAAPSEELIAYLEDVLNNSDLFPDSWCLEELYRPNFRKLITRYLKVNVKGPTV